MPRFSDRSRTRLLTADSRLIHVCSEVIKYYDFSVLCGHRTEEEQEAAFNSVPPRTKLLWPNSAHNSYPSYAVDLAPWPINWDDHLRFAKLAGIVLYVAKQWDLPLIWGGDWNRDGFTTDTKFLDLPHFEIAPEGRTR